uniref:Uncharacterized protein n=1 Tax=Arundo donax TaxID=35708 RepID=A0A0A9E9V9_ARUDO
MKFLKLFELSHLGSKCERNKNNVTCCISSLLPRAVCRSPFQEWPGSEKNC